MTVVLTSSRVNLAPEICSTWKQKYFFPGWQFQDQTFVQDRRTPTKIQQATKETKSLKVVLANSLRPMQVWVVLREHQNNHGDSRTWSSPTTQTAENSGCTQLSEIQSWLIWCISPSVTDVDNPSGTEDNIRRISKTDCDSFKTPPPMKQCNTWQLVPSTWPISF
jgi:hypothetical protein